MDGVENHKHWNYSPTKMYWPPDVTVSKALLSKPLSVLPSSPCSSGRIKDVIKCDDDRKCTQESPLSLSSAKAEFCTKAYSLAFHETMTEHKKIRLHF